MHALEDHAARLAGDIENTLVAQHVHAVSLHQHGKKGFDLFHVERSLVLPYKRLYLVVVLVLVRGEEIGRDVKNGVEVEAANIEDIPDVGVAEMHTFLHGARVHFSDALGKDADVLVAHQIGLGNEDAVGKPDLFLRFLVFGKLLRGVLRRQTDIDPLVDAKLAGGWRLNRLDSILRATLRAGAFELLERRDIPARVIISEYVDVAKEFFNGEEPKVVNGVLDKLAREQRPGEVGHG